MPQKVSIDSVPDIRDALFDLVSQYARGKRFARYADVRVEVSEGKVAVSENGMDKFSGEDYGFAFGVRVLAGEKVTAPGYFGELVGAADLPRIHERIRDALDHAYDRALANARGKEGARSRYGALGSSLADLSLAPIDVRQDTIDATYKQDPREVALEDMVHYMRDVSERVKGIDGSVAFNHVSAYTQLERQLFVSTEGANIQQTYANTQGTCFVIAAGPGRPPGAVRLYRAPARLGADHGGLRPRI